MPSSGEAAAAVLAAAAAGLAIGALIVLVIRQHDDFDPAPPVSGSRAPVPAAAPPLAPPQPIARQHPRHSRPSDSSMPMQAMSSPMGAPYMPLSAQPVSGTLLGQTSAEPDRGMAQMRRQFETEFENTVPSMEDLIRLREQNDAADLRVQPSEVLEMLSSGNVRFWTGQSRRPELNAMQRRAEIWQSYPKVAIIGCSDSRVPPEIIFDLGLGDVFVVRDPSPNPHTRLVYTVPPTAEVPPPAVSPCLLRRTPGSQRSPSNYSPTRPLSWCAMKLRLLVPLLRSKSCSF